MGVLAQEYFQDSTSNFGFEPTEQDYLRAQDLLDRVNQAVADFCTETGLPEPGLNSGHRCRARSEDLIARGYKAAINGEHEHADAIDMGDVGEHFERWWTDEKLEKYGLYREAPAATVNWVHLQTVAPHSGHRTFNP